MAELYDIMKPQNKYYDRKNYKDQQQYNNALAISSTVYVGNLSFYTTQDSIKELFSLTGTVTEIKMGIDNDGNPCGFAFVIYENRQDALLSVQFISRTKLNNRIIRVDMDPGFIQGRQKGRGSNGQQRREDFRKTQDAQRPKKEQPNTSHSGQRYQKRDYGYKPRGDYNNSRGSRQHYNDRRQHYIDRRQHGDRSKQPRQYDNRRQNNSGQRNKDRRQEENDRNFNRGDTGKQRQAKQDVDY